jgi:hypothetical protein
MMVLVWLARILAVLALLVALMQAAAHNWGGAGDSVFMGVVLGLFSHRSAHGGWRRRPGRSKESE